MAGRDENDRFRDPVGYAFRHGMSLLREAALGQVELSAAAPVLEELVRIRAAQGEALAFLDELPQSDELRRMAVEAYARCRQTLDSLQSNERRRMNFLPERMARL